MSPINLGSAVLMRVKNCREEFMGLSQKRGQRLFNKNTGLCIVNTRSIGSDACPVPEHKLSLHR